MSLKFAPDDDRLAIILDRRGSNHASITAYGEIEAFAEWVPVIVADATACNAFDRYTGALGFLRELGTSFESAGAWIETSLRACGTARLCGLCSRSPPGAVGGNH